MISDRPLISIIVPVYRAERFIENTMKCVRNQTYDNWELLLVSDGDEDRSSDIIASYIEDTKDDRIRLIKRKEKSSAAEARNQGVDEAKGEFIAYIDADDIWEPFKLERQLEFMREKKAIFSFTGYEFADENGVGLGKIVHVPKKIDYGQALKNTTIFTSTVMFDLSGISKEEIYMPIMKSEDTALWFRLLRNGMTAYGLDENLVKYRRAGKSLSSNKLEAIKRIWNLYRKAEGFGILASAYYFVFWAFNAVRRRI